VRGAFGPILTTGVALAASAVVVANPVVPTRADVQIPAVQLSAGSGDTLGMLDENFLNAIAPAPSESPNPFSVIRDLIASFAADATYLGTNVIVDAFVAGATAVTQPELTASSVPYVPSAIPSDSPVAPTPAQSLPPGLADPTAGVDDITPVVAEVVTAVINDVSYVGEQLVAAAYAAGAMLAAEPVLLVDTLRALIEGDVGRALETAVQAVVAPLGPPRIIFDAIRTVIERRLLPSGSLPTPDTPVSVQVPVSLPGAIAAESGNAAPEPGTQSGTTNRRIVPEQLVVVPRPTASTPGQSPQAVVDTQVVAPVVAPDADALISDAVDEAIDDGTGGLTAPKPTARPGRSAAIDNAVRGVQNAARDGLRGIGDTVRKATGRSERAATGRGADSAG